MLLILLTLSVVVLCYLQVLRATSNRIKGTQGKHTTRVLVDIRYPSGIDSFSFMLSSPEVPNRLFQIHFAWSGMTDFAQTPLPVPLRCSSLGRAPKLRMLRLTFALRVVPERGCLSPFLAHFILAC